ncbi:PgsA-like protein [Novosphingobium sp. Rr 2-17]|uniref:CDP-alcohol phosphatidyltransferase family protein n=1 Tax=Novosphingobium sp. Rr 2-17 TaxID=555793 RepID=UPI00026991BA|nr:CDP-alcohol phosphatidyltransferase family protein [Novosphingobium sp. Rr 2-17]EIZ79942.1 PgsA-like protein [Novosphingobium sp. Rr 2-17]
MQENRIQPVARIQENFLATAERRLLTWLCSRMPAWVKPDLLTALGLVGATLIFAGYVTSLLDENWLWLCMPGYLLHWFGDSMDGSLARFRHIERPRYGYFLDHSCDGIATFLILLGIGLSPYVRLDVALIAMVGYLLLSVHAFLAVRVLGEMRLSYLNGGPTELRLILIGLTFSMLLLGDRQRDMTTVTGFDWFVGVVGTIFISLFVIQTARSVRRLARIEPPQQ